jgi:hypothetical protein
MGLWVVCEATLQVSATLFRTVSKGEFSEVVRQQSCDK